MKKLEISEQNARKLYKDMPDFRPSLEDTFGKAFFTEKITDRIKTYEDACKELGYETDVELTDDEMLLNGFSPDEITLRKIKVITKALNEGWKPDWNDSSQYKYYPWFKMSSGGFGFGDTTYDCSFAEAGGASRLCFKSRELAEYAGKQFTKLYSDYILYQ